MCIVCILILLVKFPDGRNTSGNGMEPENPRRIDPYGFSRDACVPEETRVSP